MHSTEFLALRKALNIYINCLMFYQADILWNESTSSRIKVYIQQWFHDEQGAKFNCDQKQLWACCWVTLFSRISYWGQVVEMNFSSINFDKLLKTVSFPVICNEDTLLIMYYHTGIHFPEKKIWKIHKHSLKYKNLEKEFNNSSSEVATRGGRGGL